MFFGTVPSEIGANGRLSIPEQWRKELGNEFVITRGADPCLCIFPRDRFEAIAQHLDRWGLERTDVRSWSRFLSGAAAELVIDRTGEIEIPAGLARYAGLEQRVTMIGITSRIEIWNPSKREECESKEVAEMTQIAERIGEMMKDTSRKN